MLSECYCECTACGASVTAAEPYNYECTEQVTAAVTYYTVTSYFYAELPADLAQFF